MKHSAKLIFFLLGFMGAWSGYAQMSASLPVDDSGKITFSEVISLDSTSKEGLFQRASSFFRNLAANSRGTKTKDIVTEGSQISLPLSFKVYHEFPVKSPHGIIKYNLRIEVRQGRYRYIATDFVFHYLKRNRYGKFVEVKGKSKPLETHSFKGQQNLWEAHKTRLNEEIASLVADLKQSMRWAPIQKKPDVVRIDDQW